MQLSNAPDAFWESIASSADGTRLTAASSGFIYTSTNSGQTWLTNSPSEDWYAVASSADGGESVGGVYLGGIYTLYSLYKPQLKITATNASGTLSWPVPSTNFILEQGIDLVSWTAMTNAPVLNLTNLQNEVSIPVTNFKGFYRLSTP
jgi:hypothetical protein